VEEGTEDGTALLLRAAAVNADARTLAALKDATRRMEAKLTQQEEADAAVARGEDVPGLTRLLLNAKAASAANAERRSAAVEAPGSEARRVRRGLVRQRRRPRTPGRARAAEIGNHFRFEAAAVPSRAGPAAVAKRFGEAGKKDAATRRAIHARPRRISEREGD